MIKATLVTGATGFIGSALITRMAVVPALRVIGAVREHRGQLSSTFDVVTVGDVGPYTDWSIALRESNVIIHAAAVAHVQSLNRGHECSCLSSVNVEGTLNLARQAAAAGVRRFIFISSIGVNGNTNSQPFKADDLPSPVEPYAQSKWEAEQGLWKIQQETGMELVIIRPPLVYGPNAPGNFGSLMRWIGKGMPLPLGAIHNRRSLVGIDNLVDLIIRCVDHPAAANQVFLAGDGQDLSTTELLQGVAKAMGRPARLVPVPASLLNLGAVVLGKRALAQRLLGSLQVDISKARDLLGWEPPVSVEEGLRRCVRDSSV